MDVKRWKIGFRVDTDGDLKYLFDSKDMVSCEDHDAYVCKLNKAHMVTVNSQSARIASLEAALQEIERAASIDFPVHADPYVRGKTIAKLATEALRSTAQREVKQ